MQLLYHPSNEMHIFKRIIGKVMPDGDCLICLKFVSLFMIILNDYRMLRLRAQIPVDISATEVYYYHYCYYIIPIVTSNVCISEFPADSKSLCFVRSMTSRCLPTISSKDNRSL